ncbi:MAG: hypothetical protein KKF16_10910 [Euryarchaeota archaeon]|nr:hypothetical protein [Euryarchaeota archaeon]MBU4547364.1 hypothetical protein [Euryarchaeota archaeon]MBU4607496.1 hypothetical protein [Euryarchaeota archaeon]MBV1729157.1 hypothetical protein [Methanobacterium sp.]MBV1754717.1 hypothetical protein [Methanobacterium sp.]
MKFKALGLCILILAIVSPVFAHGVHIATESDVDVVIIADESTGALAKKVADEMGINAQVYKFTSAAQVNHELGHFVFDYNNKVLAVAYQETVEEFIANNPDTSSQVMVSAASEEEIKNALMELNRNSTSSAEEPTTSTENGFLIPFFSGLLVGLIAGIGLGVFLVKRKTNK